MSDSGMKPRIETISAKKLIGKRLTMSLSENKTGELWQSFMQSRKEIRNGIGNTLYSIQVYDPLYFSSFNPITEFDKWAASEVADFYNIPDGMLDFTLPGGLYAVFLYKGLSRDPQIFQYIFGTWLPDSGYALDNRPHFEKLGEKYKNEDMDSEEEIWIPIKF
jgi:AraC family transcriptional regulator